MGGRSGPWLPAGGGWSCLGPRPSPPPQGVLCPGPSPQASGPGVGFCQTGQLTRGPACVREERGPRGPHWWRSAPLPGTHGAGDGGGQLDIAEGSPASAGRVGVEPPDSQWLGWGGWSLPRPPTRGGGGVGWAELLLGLILLREKTLCREFRAILLLGLNFMWVECQSLGVIGGNLVFCNRRKNAKVNNNKEIWKNFSFLKGPSAFHSQEKEVSFLFTIFRTRKH